MVGYDVALGDHALHQVRAGLQVVSDHEKGGGDLVLFQGVQDRGGIAVFITGVKGEIEDLFIGHLGIGGVVLH